MRRTARVPVIVAILLSARSTAGSAQDACVGAASGVVEGQVVDFPSLVRLVGADVDVQWVMPDSERKERRTRSDSTGSFRICGVPLATRLFVRARYSGAESELRQVSLDGGTPARFVLRVTAPSAVVEGRVIDHGSGQPVASANVRLTGFREGRLTREDGTFRFDRVPAGRYAMTVDHVAFLPMHETLSVDEGNRIEATIRLAPTVIPVTPLEVVARSVRLETSGFYARQGRRIGTFITRSEIEPLRTQRPSDVLRRLAGVQFRDSRLGMQAVSRGNCPFRFVVDGARIGPGASIDDVSASAIEGIEIYMGPSQVPAEFTSISVEPSANCGVIVVWTRNRR